MIRVIDECWCQGEILGSIVNDEVPWLMLASRWNRGSGWMKGSRMDDESQGWMLRWRVDADVRCGSGYRSSDHAGEGETETPEEISSGFL